MFKVGGSRMFQASISLCQHANHPYQTQNKERKSVSLKSQDAYTIENIRL